MQALVDTKLAEQRKSLMRLLTLLQQLTQMIGHEKLIQTTSELAFHSESPFTFVIVGEVKAGKSSFINALLGTGKEICKVAPAPMTDTIQQILYGEQEQEVILNPYLKKLYQPVEILKDIAIVDTPGTNTIISHHQEITEKFIPYADLIVFVFEAKNPYRQSSWDFFDFIHDEWKRKIIFVLQQKDLLSDEDLRVNTQGVQDYAKKKGIEQPRIFATSAKAELEGEFESSGFYPLRDYIHQNITGGKAAYLKLKNTVNTVMTINQKLAESISVRQRQFESDKRFRADIRDIMDHQEAKTGVQIDQMVDNLLLAYNSIVQEKTKDLETGLGFFNVLRRSVGSIFGKESGIKEWLVKEASDFELRLHKSLKDKLQHGITDVADAIQLMGKMVDNRIKHSETILQNSDEIFADIAEKRIQILRELQESFQDFMSNSESFYDKNLMEDSSRITPNLAAGSGIAIVGVILAAAVQGAVFDITGGVLTAVGVLFAGVTLGLNKGKILRKFEEETAKGRNMISQDVKTKLTEYTSRIRKRIDSNFAEFVRMLEYEEKTLQSLNSMHQTIKSESELLDHSIQV